MKNEENEMSDTKSSDLLGLAQRMETAIDTIFVGTSAVGRKFMEELSRAAGGRSIVKGVELLEDSVVRLLTQ